MKKLLALALGVALLGLVTAQAEEKKEAKKEWTAEQKKLRKEMTTKYDTNKDGKIDKEERAKISEDDKKKMKDAGIGRSEHKEGEKKEKKK